ncbi:MAG: hypothetical protein A2Z72_06435 [Omnitrophica bacterium RBG_13_46_9]|nr:MAG: hypothetical protein A2Z72_06435 [Omnitrophica bacterium RBG_13_46_9]
MRYIRVLLILAIIVPQIPAQPACAFQEDLLKSVKASEQPVVVKGDKVEYFRDQNKVVGEGSVSITYGDVALSCDKITVYTDTKEAICEGNVKITQPGASMEGDKINYNLSEKRGYALNSEIKAKPFYGAAKRVAQTEDEKFELEDGYITTCDLEKPHYRIRAKEVQIFPDKKIVAKHITFYVGNIPVLYMPLYVQPLIEKKPEVTVVPGRTSEWGYYALTAWRYYFNDDSKGYVYLDYREKKGLAEGISYSYDTKTLGNGVAQIYYTHENDDLTITKTGQADDRWRIQERHTIRLPEDTVCTLEFNKLSDESFIKDYFYREYEENPIPDNYVLVETTKPNYVSSLLVRKRMNDFFEVVERLPEYKLEVFNQQLWGTNFYYSSRNSITNFIKRYNNYYTQEDRSPDKALRIDNFYKFSYAAKLFNFLYVTPFVTTRQTFYSMNRWKERSELRSIYDEGVDISTKFYRVFDINSNFMGLDMHRLRHIITPSATFLHRHQPTISPDNLYQFDEIDNIDYYNGFTLSLENKLQTKRPDGDAMKTVDLATLIVSTDYLFRLKKNFFESKGDGKFGDLNFKLELRPYSWLSIDGDMVLDYKDHNINSANIDLYVHKGEKFVLGVGQRYESTENGTTSLITGEMSYLINSKWKIQTYQRYDINSQKWEEQEYTVYRDLHCWLAELTYNKRNDEHTVWLLFKLKAFPDVPIGLFKTTYRRPYPGGMR